ncbi:unnamed protein product, partial [Heterotrigona itama]
KVAREDVESTEPTRIDRETQESLERSFTPSLARRLSRTLIEQTRRSLTRSPPPPPPPPPPSRSISRALSAERDADAVSEAATDRSISTVSDQTEYKDRRAVRRANSLLEPRRTVVGLFDDHHHRGSLFLGASPTENSNNKWYKESSGKLLRKDSFRSYRADKIQEEASDDLAWPGDSSVSEYTSQSASNPLDAATTSSLSTRSDYDDTWPTESSSACKSSPSSSKMTNLESRLLAAENLIKESKLRNSLGSDASSLKFDRNLKCSYRDTDKCEKRSSLISIAESSVPRQAAGSKRRSCIPSLRLRSGSLTRESNSNSRRSVEPIDDRRKSFADSQDLVARTFANSEKSLLSKLFKAAAGDAKGKEDEQVEEEKDKEKSQRSKQRRISRFLRPDFFDTPREESRYVKEKEAQKAAENERRKSRFIKRKSESKAAASKTGEDQEEDGVERERRQDKELKNEINCLRRDRCSRETKARTTGAAEGSRNGNERKTLIGDKGSRERSAPPVDHPSSDERVVAVVKRTVSVEDLSRRSRRSRENGENCSSKSRTVSSVLGLFKNADAKQRCVGNGQARSQATAFLSKLKKSPPKLTTKHVTDEDATATTVPTVGSKIPTKLATDVKSTKSSETSRRVVGGARRSASREKEAEEEISAEATVSNDDKKKSTTPSAWNRAKQTSRSSMENGSSSAELPGKLAGDVEKKLDGRSRDSTRKKCEAVSESNGDTGDAGVRKKTRMVRVVKKVAKKSSGPPPAAEFDKTNSEGKEKSVKSRTKRKTTATGEDKGSDKGENVERNGFESESTRERLDGKSSNDRADDPPPVVEREEPQQRANRCNLKLDLSKIPQHSFRNATPKKDASSRSSDDSPDSKSTTNQDLSGKLAECLSKVTHRASIAGNKIIIDKPLRAKDVAELKREVTECAKIIESHAFEDLPSPPLRQSSSQRGNAQEGTREDTTTVVVDCCQRPNDQLVLLSPTVDEPESFDSWSISSSTELNHARPDLHSPTSPSHSLFARNDNNNNNNNNNNNSDNSESMIDRIRRRSFYSRFNDRRRPSLAAPPPGVLLPSSSATLPRKFSLAGHHSRGEHRELRELRELRDRGRYSSSGYAGLVPKIGSRHTADKSYVYGEDGVTIGRTGHRYSDIESPTTEHAIALSSSYDPLARYLRSPTFDLSASRSRYHSADFAADPELATAYRFPLSSLSNDSGLAAAARGSGYSSLPRKYGIAEPKTIEYYEELLSPSTAADYLSVARRSPLSGCENGYYSENSDLRSQPSAKLARRSCAENNARTNQDFSDGSDLTSAGSCCDEQSTEHR